MADEDDDGQRMRRRERGRSADRHVERRDDDRVGVPGKSTLTPGVSAASSEVALSNAIGRANGAASRIAIWGPQLQVAMAASDYGEAGRLSFEIRSAFHRASNELAEIARHAPEVAAQATDQIGAARKLLARQASDLVSLLRAAPIQDHLQ